MAIAAVLDEVLERRSKLLFGNRHMLQVARDVSVRVGVFTSLDVARVTGVPYTTVHRLLRQLELVGLLEQAAGDEPGQQLWFRRVSHQFWGAVSELCVDRPGPAGSEISRA